MRQTRFLAGGRVAPTTNSCTGSGDNAPRKKCSQFIELIGSVVVLPTTRDIYEPTVYLYGESGRNCQARGPLGKNSQSRIASHRLCRWLFVLHPADQRASPLRDQIESEDSRSCGSTTVPSAAAARVPAGSCSTVARWPSHKRATNTSCPSGNSSAS